MPLSNSDSSLLLWTLTLFAPSSTATLGLPYSSAFTVTGGVAPYTFSISAGAIPGGLSLNPSTGAITGTPNTVGTFSFTGEVMDSSGVTPGNIATNQVPGSTAGTVN